MKSPIIKYFEEMTGLMNSIIVITDKKILDLYQGIKAACCLIREIGNKGKKIMFIGNGGSAAIAIRSFGRFPNILKEGI